MEFTNVLNRTEFNSPTLAALTNPQAARTCLQPTGGSGSCQPGYQTQSGFGFINNSTVAVNPRQGQAVAQFRF
jgi:hypothetical protein